MFIKCEFNVFLICRKQVMKKYSRAKSEKEKIEPLSHENHDDSPLFLQNTEEIGTCIPVEYMQYFAAICSFLLTMLGYKFCL